MRKILAATVIFMISGCSGETANGETAALDQKDRPWATLNGAAPLIIAHRGASGHRPEHTLEAYELAIEMGADIIEPDLVVTKDGVLVARHDRYLSTTTNVSDMPEFADRRRANPNPESEAREDWWVEDFTLAELKSLRARQPFPGRSKEFDDEFEIPTFAEVLALAAAEAERAGRPVGVYPETKHPGYFASIDLDFEAPLLAALKGFDAGPVFIQSFEPDILKRLKGKTTARLVQLVLEEAPGAGSNIPLTEIAAYADGVGPQKSIVLSSEGAPTAMLATLHRAGLFVHPWTFRDDAPNPALSALQANAALPARCLDWDADELAERELCIAFASGVDAVFTDFPDTAYAVRERLGKRRP